MLDMATILDECSLYYSPHILTLKNKLTPSFLCEILMSNKKETIISKDDASVKFNYINQSISYKITFDDLANYNLYVILDINPAINKIVSVSLNIKTYSFNLSSTIGSFVFSRHDNTYRGYAPLIPITYSTITNLAKLAKCPYKNIFIIPFYYVDVFNELDSLLTLISTTTRKVKYRKHR